MTNEEAIEIIKNGRYEFPLLAGFEDDETTAIRMAIQALEKLAKINSNIERMI